MSAAGAETHRNRGDLLNALGWLVCVGVTLALAVAAAHLRGGSGGFQAGRVTGGVLGAFVIAFIVGLPIQWGLRKRHTLPAWIGAIAVVVSALSLLGSAAAA